MSQNFEKIEKVTAPALDKILGKPFKVLNDGFIRVVDYLGSDDSIVQAARVSYGKGTKKVSEDRGLIRYLLRHRHTTPFEMCEIKFHVRVPMDIWRQWIRHRTANVNEYSTRYSIAIDSAEYTLPGEWRVQAQNNRQGSDGFLNDELGKELTDQEAHLQQLARDTYNKRIELGVAREQARKDLPLATYTEAYWKIDLHNLLHFLELRIDKHAQFEIRSYAEVIFNEILRKWCPITWDAFKDYRLNAVNLTGRDAELLKHIYANDKDSLLKEAASYGWLNRSEKGLKSNRERIEFEEKLEKLGITVSWE